jgi:hypothetical protein
MRSIGFDAALEGLREKQTLDQVTGTMIKDIVSTAIHPWTGPGLGFAVKAATGKSISLHDFPGAAIVPGGGGSQYVENVRSALEDINPFLYSMVQPILRSSGIDTKGEKILGPTGQFIEEKTGFHAPAKTADVLLQSFSGAFGVKDVLPGKSAAEKMAMDISSMEYKGLGPPNQEKKEISDLKDKYFRMAMKDIEKIGDVSDETIKAVAADTRLSDKDLEAIDARIETEDLIHAIKGMSFENALRVYKVATPEEREKLNEVFDTKYDSLSDEDKVKFDPLVDKILEDTKTKLKKKDEESAKPIIEKFITRPVDRSNIDLSGS